MTIGIIILLVGAVFLAGGVLYLMYHRPLGHGNELDKALHAMSKYDSNLNRFVSRKETVAATERGNLAAALVQEVDQVINLIRKRREALMETYRTHDASFYYQMEREKYLSDHIAYLAEAQNRRVVADFASAHNLPSSIVSQIATHVIEGQIEMMTRQTQLNSEIYKHQQMKQIDLEVQKETWKYKVQLGLEAKALTGHKKEELIQNLLDTMYKQIEEIQTSSFLPETKQKMIADRNALIAKWRKQLA